MLDGYILPKMGNLRVVEVAHQDIQKFHNQMREPPDQANRTLALVSKVLELSLRWGMRSDNPARGVEKFPEKKRDRRVSDEELSRLLAKLAEHPKQIAADSIRSQLLTGALRGAEAGHIEKKACTK